MIVEDEPVSQELLSRYISDIRELELVAMCSNAIEAGELLRKQAVDLMFLDINMPKLSGTAFYYSLLNPPAVIFTTAYPEFAVDGFNLNAVDYLVKPFGFDRFSKAVSKYLQSRKVDHAGFIMVQADKKTHRVNLEDIAFVEAMGDYIKLRTKDQHLIVHQTLARMTEQLPSTIFRRIHKSFVIALPHLEFIEGNMAVVQGQRIPIGQTYRNEFLGSLSGK
jgi:DNA-binding LytR/AlgR family response regulator